MIGCFEFYKIIRTKYFIYEAHMPTVATVTILFYHMCLPLATVTILFHHMCLHSEVIRISSNSIKLINWRWSLMRF